MNEIIHFLTQHGTLVLFTVVFAELIGLPLPALPFLIAAGALVGTGQMALGVTVGSAVLAALAGDLLWLALGRRHGRRVLNRLCRSSLDLTSFVRRSEEVFARHGVRSLVVAKFVPGLSTIAAPLAGIVGVSVPLFLWYDILGTLLWVGSGIGFGYALSGQLEQALTLAGHVAPTVGLVLLGSVMGCVVYKALHQNRVERLVPPLTPQQVIETLAAGAPRP
jgi:membrane protein DedA with SNARE-associated domain